MSEFVAWPQTLAEFRAEISAYSLDVTKPPYHRTRYKTLDDAYAAAIEAGEPLFRDDWLDQADEKA